MYCIVMHIIAMHFLSALQWYVICNNSQFWAEIFTFTRWWDREVNVPSPNTEWCYFVFTHTLKSKVIKGSLQVKLAQMLKIGLSSVSIRTCWLLSVMCMTNPRAGPQHCRMKRSDSETRNRKINLCYCWYNKPHNNPRLSEPLFVHFQYN